MAKRPKIKKAPHSKKQAQKINMPPEGKKPRASHPPTFNQYCPSWRLQKLDWKSCYGWHDIDRKSLKEIRDKLKAYESMTWDEILIGSKKQNHTVPCYKLSKTARKRLQVLQLDDVDELISLRVGGKGRIWGIRQQSVLLLLWWDPEHEVCPSPKKHT